MKAKFEQIIPNFGSSFVVREFVTPIKCATSFWHIHPEYEIVYLQKGNGTRHIGNNTSPYYNGELVFIGSNVPHFGYEEVNETENYEIVIQFRENFMGKGFFDQPEMQAIKQLFERSKSGVIFHESVKHQIGEQLQELLVLSPFERLIRLLQIFQTLAKTNDYTLLNASQLAFEVDSLDYQRMQLIHSFIQNKFKKSIDLQEVASLTNLTIPAFCRFFKRITNKTFTNFVNEIRVNHACHLLGNDNKMIATIAYESGFNNLSHFNQHFKKITGKSPSIYRKGIRKMVE